jgi:hypothetical protein
MWGGDSADIKSTRDANGLQIGPKIILALTIFNIMGPTSCHPRLRLSSRTDMNKLSN